MEQNQNENYLAILHPELMSREELLQELKQRKIEEPGQQSMGNSQLVDLFYRTVVPLPQRKYRLNRRGKVMTKRQILLAKRKRTYNAANAPNSETTTEVISIYSRGQERERNNLQESSVVRDRLKPPPGASGGERKIIRLTSKSESTSASSMATVSSTSDTSDKHSSNVTKIVPHKEGQSTSVSKPIKIKRHNFDKKPEGAIDKTANDTVSSTTDIKTYTSSCRSEEKKDANEEPVVKKFKKISITWP